MREMKWDDDRYVDESGRIVGRVTGGGYSGEWDAIYEGRVIGRYVDTSGAKAAVVAADDTARADAKRRFAKAAAAPDSMVEMIRAFFGKT